MVIGSGPGIGRSTARYFADKGSKHIVLLSRDESRLAEDAKFVTSAASGVKVDTFKIDVSADEVSVKRSLSNVDDSLKTAGVRLEVVLYNAARVAPSKIMEWDAKGLEDDLKMTTVIRSHFYSRYLRERLLSITPCTAFTRSTSRRFTLLVCRLEAL